MSHTETFFKIRSSNLMPFSIFCTGIISIGDHIIFESQSFQDYVNSVYMATVMIGEIIEFVYITLNMEEMFGQLNEAEQIVNSNELKFVRQFRM